MICRPTQLEKLKIRPSSYFSKKYFEELKLIKGDMGARKILNKNEKFLNSYETDDDSYFLDLDTPEDFTNWESRSS